MLRRDIIPFLSIRQTQIVCKYIYCWISCDFSIDDEDLLLGNDISGDKLYTVPIEQSKSKADNETGKLETLDADAFPGHIVI